MIKRITAIVLIVIMSVFAFASCGDDTKKKKGTRQSEVPANGGTANFACVSVDTMNPIVTRHATVTDFLSLVYEGLFVLRSDLTVEPVLAEGYKVSKNNTLITIKLKDNVHFHSGKKFKAEDVIATLDYMALYSTGFKSFMQYIEAYYSEDDYTVVIKLNTSKSDFVNNLDFPILPAGHMSDDFLPENPSFRPNGTGMYKYDDTIAYKNIILVANENWHSASDRPYIDKIDVEILSDEDTIVSAFDAGAIDTLTTSWVGFGELELTSSVFNTFETEQNRFTFLGINCNCAVFDTDKERRYLSSSIDSNKLTEDIMLDHAVSACSPVREGVYYNPKQDMSGTKSQSGSQPGNEDDELIKCRLLYNSDSKTKNRLAVAVKQQLEAAGYLVTLDGKKESEYFDAVALSKYDLYIGEVLMTGSCDLQFMFSSPMGGICNYDDSEFRNLVNNIDLTYNDIDKTKSWEIFEKYYEKSVPQVPIYFTNRASFVNKRINGKLKPNLSNPYYGFDDMYLETKKTSSSK